jgi:predicted nucleic acid-binding protein
MVIDASIVHPATLHPKGPAMRAMLAAPGLRAPELLVLEVAGALRNRVRRSEVALADANQALARLQRLPIIRHPLLPLLDRVWELRDNLTPYDAAYVALAERLKVPLLTADAGIARAPGLHCKVRLLKL